MKAGEQKKKVSLKKQAAAEPAVAPTPPVQGKKVSLAKQPMVKPTASVPAASKPVSALPVSSATAPRAESASQGDARSAADAGDKKKGASSGRKIMGILAVLIVIAIVVILLLKNCGSEFVQPSQESFPQPGSLSEPELASTPEAPEPPGLPALTYGAFYFMGNSNSFLPGLNYEGRLSAVAQDIKEILKVKPVQMFLISGYSADIPGHNQGELELSIQRADRVRNFLIQLGVPQTNLECAYRGGTGKWGNNSSESTRSPNRVVTIELMD
jgi:OOP family OmpA-OmpF porin